MYFGKHKSQIWKCFKIRNTLTRKRDFVDLCTKVLSWEITNYTLIVYFESSNLKKTSPEIRNRMNIFPTGFIGIRLEYTEAFPNSLVDIEELWAKSVILLIELMWSDLGENHRLILLSDGTTLRLSHDLLGFLRLLQTLLRRVEPSWDNPWKLVKKVLNLWNPDNTFQDFEETFHECITTSSFQIQLLLQIWYSVPPELN